MRISGRAQEFECRQHFRVFSQPTILTQKAATHLVGKIHPQSITGVPQRVFRDRKKVGLCIRGARSPRIVQFTLSRHDLARAASRSKLSVLGNRVATGERWLAVPSRGLIAASMQRLHHHATVSKHRRDSTPPSAGSIEIEHRVSSPSAQPLPEIGAISSPLESPIAGSSQKPADFSHRPSTTPPIAVWISPCYCPPKRLVS